MSQEGADPLQGHKKLPPIVTQTLVPFILYTSRLRLVSAQRHSGLQPALTNMELFLLKSNSIFALL